jgi:signal transduction histidine kinase
MAATAASARDPLPHRRRLFSDRLGDLALAAAVFVGVLGEWAIQTAWEERPRGPYREDFRSPSQEHEYFERGEHDGSNILGLSSAPLGDSVPAVLLVVALAMAAMLVRRRRPWLAVGLAAFAAALGSLAIHIPFALCAAFAMALYSLAAERGWLPAAIVGASAASVVLLATLINGEEAAAALFVLFCLVAVAIPLLAAIATRSRRAYLAEVETRLATAELERTAEAARAVAEERVTLARDLHDVLAHSLTVVTMQVGVASHLVESHPDRAKVALEEARLAGAAAMDELKTTLALLRGESPESRNPVPSLADIPALVARVAATGLPVSLSADPTLGPTAGVPESVGLVAYRVVQEGLTNVVRHAGATTPTSVVLARDSGSLVVTVRDEGIAQPAAHAGNTGSGLGLTGLAERVHALGGAFTAGELAAGGFEVRAVLPVPTTNPPPPDLTNPGRTDPKRPEDR